jgi:hypothetical protein
LELVDKFEVSAIEMMEGTGDEALASSRDCPPRSAAPRGAGCSKAGSAASAELTDHIVDSGAALRDVAQLVRSLAEAHSVSGVQREATLLSEKVLNGEGIIFRRATGRDLVAPILSGS